MDSGAAQMRLPNFSSPFQAKPRLSKILSVCLDDHGGPMDSGATGWADSIADEIRNGPRNKKRRVNRAWSPFWLISNYFSQGEHWLTADGHTLSISEMNDDHVLDSLLFLERVTTDLLEKGGVANLQDTALYQALKARALAGPDRGEIFHGEPQMPPRKVMDAYDAIVAARESNGPSSPLEGADLESAPGPSEEDIEAARIDRVHSQALSNAVEIYESEAQDGASERRAMAQAIRFYAEATAGAR